MQRIINIMFFSASVFLVSCGAKSDTGRNTITEKKARLEDLRKQQASISQEILKVEAEIAKLDPSAAKAEKAKLVSTDTIEPVNFTHFIDLQGRVDAENIAYVTPRNGTGGQVKAVYVKKGQNVKKGQLLLKLDDAILRQQIEQAKTQLAYAKDIYQRRANLWKENIGSEVELISTKNNVDQAQRQLDLLNEQLSFTNVVADMNGIAEDVTIRVGEFFTGSPQAGFIKLVNNNSLKVITDVPENYLDRVKVGTNVQVNFPDINKTLNAKVTLSGRLIDPNTRSFYVEARLPSDKDIRPNQLALVRIQDYSSPKAITVPVNTLQTDEKGKFILVAANENGKLVARKRQVTEGQMYGDKLEIKSGLQAGDVVITEGHQGLYDGQLLTTSA